MPIIACGINHKTAAVDLREKVIFASDKISLYLQDLLHAESVEEAVLLSTCNRSEIYCQASQEVDLLDWFCNQHQVDKCLIQPVWYCYYDLDAVQHMMKVACGLDSMVIGEPEIFGQMKAAFSESCAAGSIGAQFNRLFQHIFAVTKEVRTTTFVGACPVSIASAAVNLAKQVITKTLQESKILLIGAGDTIRLVLRHLQSHQAEEIVIANRNIKAAEELKQKTVSLSSLKEQLLHADLVISATNSSVPIVTKDMLLERTRPIPIIDIAVPRDVASEVAELACVQLFSIDDLKSRIQQNISGREHAAQKALEMIQLKSKEYLAWLHSLNDVALTIKAYRKQIEDLCHAELIKAERLLRAGEDASDVLISFANALTNKLLHHPSVQLRQAGLEGRLDMVHIARQLFALSEIN